MCIKLLILEDSQLDAELMLRELRSMEDEFEKKIVSTREEFIQLLNTWNPDVIISDYNLATFKGDEALALAKKQLPEVPFITVSGSITKEMEVKLLENRANDVLTKSNFRRLPFAINRVLNEKKDKFTIKSTLNEIQDHLKFQEVLAEISLEFNSSDSFDNKVQFAISKIGQITNVSRVYIFEDDAEEGTYTNTYEWCAEGVEPQMDNLINVPYAETPSLRPALIEEGKLYASEISDLPVDIAEALEPQNIKALIVRPIFIADKFFGFIGLDETKSRREWTKSEDRLLKTISGILSNAYSEKAASETLIKKNKELELALSEKETLVQEVHHRVKNNMALISGFLELDRLDSREAATSHVINKNMYRIKSIALIHELMYKTRSFSQVEIGPSLKTILHFRYSAVEFLNTESIQLNINQAVPFALLINELISIVSDSSDKYHLRKNQRIKIEIYEENGIVYFSFFEKELVLALQASLEKSNGVYSDIINALTTQLHAIMKIDSEKECLQINFEKREVKGSSSRVF